MDSLSVITPKRTRRRFSPEFKADIVAQCRQPGVSVARVALDNDLNANMVRCRTSQVREDRLLGCSTGSYRAGSHSPVYTNVRGGLSF